MKVRNLGPAAALALALGVTAPALAGCVLGRVAQLSVTTLDDRPTVTAGIDGTQVTFLVDSGSFYSMLWRAEAARLRLPLEPENFSLRVQGVGGWSRALVVTARDFTLAQADLKDMQFITVPTRYLGGIAGVIGENILRLADTEYDLENGVIRIWRPHGCGNSELAYWVKNQPYSTIDIEPGSTAAPEIIGSATLNGTKIRVMLDTGAPGSVIFLSAAERAGFRRAGIGVEDAGVLHGVGPQPVKSWIDTFATFTIGGETIRNAPLRVADGSLEHIDMVLGADFFLANRIYVAVGQHKLYFTYNGGPVFRTPHPPAHAVGHARSPAPSPAGAPPEAP